MAAALQPLPLSVVANAIEKDCTRLLDAACPVEEKARAMAGLMMLLGTLDPTTTPNMDSTLEPVKQLAPLLAAELKEGKDPHCKASQGG